MFQELCPDISGTLSACFRNVVRMRQEYASGTAIMPFADVKDDKVDMDTLQIVRIPTGTQITISANKAHFVAVAEGDTPYSAVVVAPVMDAPRTALPEMIMGIQ
jgi:hypothetical protein